MLVLSAVFYVLLAQSMLLLVTTRGSTLKWIFFKSGGNTKTNKMMTVTTATTATTMMTMTMATVTTTTTPGATIGLQRTKTTMMMLS